MTYAFGAYVDPEMGVVRDDLDWIKSDQKVRGGRKGETVRDFKSSYKKLATELGAPFSTALERGRAVSADDFDSADVTRGVAQRVMLYQAQRLRDVFSRDTEMSGFVDDLPSPSAVFAPYFYIEQSQSAQWIGLNRNLVTASVAAAENLGVPIHAVICCYRELLTDKPRSESIIAFLRESHVDGVWLWFSQLDEHDATAEELSALRFWVEQLSPSMNVYNMHGGFFSLTLSKFGMAGIAHGVGYGEQKDVVPVIGQSTPTVQYYVRPLHDKYSVVQIIRGFSILGIRTPEDFFQKVCDCVICKGVIGKDLSRGFAQFGDIYRSRPDSKRMSQTPAAAKRCRFHFLLNRIKERQYVRATPLPQIIADTRDAASAWSRTVLGPFSSHLSRWITALR
jgi:hypothetical protein